MTNLNSQIEIDIIDTNSRDPFALEDRFNFTHYVYENETTGFEIMQLVSEDLDRDRKNYTIDNMSMR
jgi:hypothetical protein